MIALAQVDSISEDDGRGELEAFHGSFEGNVAELLIVVLADLADPLVLLSHQHGQALHDAMLEDLFVARRQQLLAQDSRKG